MVFSASYVSWCLVVKHNCKQTGSCISKQPHCAFSFKLMPSGHSCVLSPESVNADPEIRNWTEKVGAVDPQFDISFYSHSTDTGSLPCCFLCTRIWHVMGTNSGCYFPILKPDALPFYKSNRNIFTAYHWVGKSQLNCYSV
jgi:hypothetical protein